jgi:hypothetical protein
MNENEIKIRRSKDVKTNGKILGILLAVCFLMSVTAAAVSAGPVVVKEKKTTMIILKDVKTKFFKHNHHKNTNMNGGKGKKMGMKTGTNIDMSMNS